MTCDDETRNSCADPSAVSSDGMGVRLKTKVTAESARAGVVERSRDRERMDRATVVARRARAFFDSHPFVVTHPSIGNIASTSQVDSIRRAARAWE